jgi:hypothetical protein
MRRGVDTGRPCLGWGNRILCGVQLRRREGLDTLTGLPWSSLSLFLLLLSMLQNLAQWGDKRLCSYSLGPQDFADSLVVTLFAELL